MEFARSLDRDGARVGRYRYMTAGQIGRFLVVAAAVLGITGLVLLAASAIGVGRLPGDLRFGSGKTGVYLPLATSVLVSVVATVVLNLIVRR